MLKRIRKTSKQMTRGKSSGSLDDLDNAEAKPQGTNGKAEEDKPQEIRRSDSKKAQGGRDKPQLERKKSKKERNNKAGASKDLEIEGLKKEIADKTQADASKDLEIEALKKEIADKTQADASKDLEIEGLKKVITSLQTEVAGLRDDLEKENTQFDELKALKTQQIQALTVKLATAIRQKEAAESEILQKNGNTKRLPSNAQGDRDAAAAKPQVDRKMLNEVQYLRGEVGRLEKQLEAESSQHGALTDLSSQLATAVKHREEALADAFREKVNGEKHKAQVARYEKECELLGKQVGQLQGEIRRLKERVEQQERDKTEQISELSEQVSGAVRQREEALEEVEKLRAELNLLTAVAEKKPVLIKDPEEEVEKEDIRQNGCRTENGINESDAVICNGMPKQSVLEEAARRSRDSNNHDSGSEKSKRNSTTERCFSITGIPVQPVTEQTITVDDRELVDLVNGEVETVIESAVDVPELEKLPSNLSASEMSDFTDTTDNCSDTDSENYGLKVVTEFQRVQKDLSDVKHSMSVVQALSERLSGDLQVLEAKRKAGYRRKSGSPRRRKIATSESNGNAPVSPATKVQSKSDGNSPKDTIVTSSDVPDGSIKSPSPSSAYESWITKEFDVKKQLLRALNELDTLRNDNREIKEQMKLLAASTGSHEQEDFLLRTTHYTDELLREMRARDRQIKTSPRYGMGSSYLTDNGKLSPRVSVSSSHLEETKLNPRLAGDSGYLGDSSLLSVDTLVQAAPSYSPLDTSHPEWNSFPELAPRPQSAEPIISAQTTESLQQAPPRGHHRYSVPSKLGESALLDRSDGLLYRMNRGADHWGERFRKPLQLSKGWKSTDSITPHTSTLGYRDYLQRHVVRSSNSIAKVRDLTAEELCQMAI